MDDDDDDSSPFERMLRRTAAAHVAHHQELVQLAAARTRAAAVNMVLSRRNRQRARMVPLVLAVGARVRVSYLVASSIRRALKTAHVSAYTPRWTEEVYVVRERRLAPGSTRVVLYALEAEDEELVPGEQGGTQCGQLYVRLGLSLTHVDRRYLQPLPAAAVMPSLARRFPGLGYAFRVVPPSAADGESSGEDFDDFDADTAMS
jgi:hypothetical protein